MRLGIAGFASVAFCHQIRCVSGKFDKVLQAKLVKVGDGQKSTSIRLRKLPITVGRGREADLTLIHPMISRIHCEFYEVDGTLCIRDMGSMNGTFVGDIRITEAALETGDLLTLGGATFEVVVGDDDDVIEPPALKKRSDSEQTDVEKTTSESSASDESTAKTDAVDNEDAAKTEQTGTKSEETSDQSGEDKTLGSKAGQENAEPDVFDFTPGNKGKKSDGPNVNTEDDDLTDFLAGLN